jgi:iron(III) transport system substrate-binding protein
MHSMGTGAGMTRRRFLSLGAAGLGAAAIGASCSSRATKSEVVLYSSVDEPILRPILREFERRSGIAVRVVGDTEATKSTGLIERLLAERERPRADVWWSSEHVGVIELARAGVLEALEPRCIADYPAGWPTALRDPEKRWHGFGLRARVIAHSTTRIDTALVPATLGGLLGERLRGRVGMASPAFGTTRAHLAALVAERGEEATRAWLSAMKESGLKVYSGNSAVVRAISQGEIDVGLTDTDDVHAGRANGWKVGMVFEEVRTGPQVPGPPAQFSGGGALVVPNTVARIRGGPNAANAGVLIEFIASEDVERLLLASDSRNTPVREALLTGRPELRISGPWLVDSGRIADSLGLASTMARSVLGPG